MGREIRRVPATWQHPSDHRGLKPLFDGSYGKEARAWLDNAIAWDNGTHKDAAENKAEHPFFWEWDGGPPKKETYMPDWPDAERTHYQMYENVTEGTPISPPMASPEELAQWLADNHANAGAGATASYDAWLRVCKGGYAPSMIMAIGSDGSTRIMSGVEGLSDGES